MKQEPITYAKQWVDEDDIREVVKVLQSDTLTQGHYVTDFEKALAKRVGAKYAVAVSNGTTALHIAYLALGLKPKEQVITTPITFAATANAGFYAGAKPVFVDTLPTLPLIDPDKIESKITKQTKIIAPVHFGGMVCDMPKIAQIAQKHNLFVVEDACHALGSRGNDHAVGSCKYSDITIFSFHPVKHITTGEGGAITTNDNALYNKLLLLRSHGITRENFVNTPDSPRYYEMVTLGFNCRLTDIQAALGLSQLKKLDFFIEKRRKIANLYKDKFAGVDGITLMPEPENIFNAYHLFPVLFQSSSKRDKIFHLLFEMGVQTQIHYMPLYRHPYYIEHGFKNTRRPNAERYYSRVLSLPMYPKMSMNDADYVVSCVKKAIKEAL